ncbi:maleylpyruvate isomerase N-terminal domain-containing protein [Streptomyces roseolilacinus]|uniref:maleylpyruvate isomerase N-terminal domain-containing protein n=1 Tax=Streptomyces roseolilacinus TaxID=66904 RepID=UPI0038303635
MTEARRPPSGPVTAADVEHAVRSALATLRGAEASDWSVKAGSLEWDCWETVEHLADDLFAYAVQLGPANLPPDTHVPFAWSRRRPGGPANAVFADREAGPAGLLHVLDAGGALLTAMVRTTPPTARAHHVFGAADPEGFAAMGVVETLVHTHDVAEGLGVDWTPPADLCDRVLARLFPDAPTDTDRWPTLLWATGRAELPGRPRLATWRWYGTPRADGRP